MKNFLITGAAGFLGSNLCNALIKEGHKVTGLDNLYTGSLKNLDVITEHPNFNFLQEDVRIPLDLKNDFDEFCF